MRRIIRICLVCASRDRFRWASVDGACDEHRDARLSDRVPEHPPVVTALEAS